MKTNIIGAIAVVALVVGIFGLNPAAQEKAMTQIGALAGPDVASYLNVQGYFVQGGNRVSIDPGTATYTLTTANMQDNSLITFAASTTQAALTVTLPASTSFPLPQAKGASRTWVIENPFTAAATTTTIAAGTGIDLQEPDGQNVVIGINNYAFINCIRGADSGAPEDIVCSIDETIPAD